MNTNIANQDTLDFEYDLDKDDGVLSYKIEFKSNNIEYEYDIDANNKSILSFNKGKID